MERTTWVVAGGIVVAVLALRFGSRQAAAQSARGSGVLAAGIARTAAARGDASVRALVEQASLRTREARTKRVLAEKLRDMPDLTQTDPALGVEGGGDSWCGPVAVSNALVWLSERGHASLASTGSDRRERQLELVRQLGSGRYMGTTATGGTGTGKLLAGLERFLHDAGTQARRLEYQGWRGHPFRFTTHTKIPELDFIKRALADGGVVVIHAGWYKKGKWGADFHRRHGGHWLTVVGTDVDLAGNPAPGTLVVHDPAPYAGSEPMRHWVSLERFESGWLIAEDGAFPAKGYARLTGEMRIKREGEIAVLDGAVALVL